MDAVAKSLLASVLLAFSLSAGKSAVAAEPLTLWGAMERAAQSNPALRSQQAEIARQALEQDIARGRRFPQVDLDASYLHHAYPTTITPIRAAGVFPPLDRDIASVGVALNLPLYAGGKLVAGEALAAHNREAAVQALRAGGQDLLFNVAATYTKALHFRQLAKVLDTRITALQREEHDIELRIREGRAARLELIRLQTQLSQARYDRLSVAQGEQDALTLLAAFLGDASLRPALAEPGATAPALPGSAEEAMDRALRQRPDLLKLDAAGKAAQQKTAIARGDRLPQVNLVAKAQETAGGDWQGYDDWQVGVQFSLPVFDGNVRKRRVEQAGLEQRQNALQQDDARNRVASEVGQAFGALTESTDRLHVAAQGEKEAAEALRIETLRYHGGENTITDLLGAESALWNATASRLQAGYDIVVSQARLLRATGELAPDSFRPVPPGADAGGSASGPSPDPAGQYLAWHPCRMPCGDETSGADSAAAKPQDSAAPRFMPRPVQQGASQ
ncbi:MAG: TolC family protein [Betaproteobacteria bacterium]|nr:TolC family protein [Betaproteobacteria bacterium]